MIVSHLQKKIEDDIHTLSAMVEWEDNPRDSIEVFFRVYGNGDLINDSDYNAFLVACVLPALRYGERRIQIDGPVCPWLVDNLRTMLAYYNHWYWYDHGSQRGESVTIEAKSYTACETQQQSRVGTFFSGGVDSIYTLRKNQITIPEKHPGRIRDIIFLHGFDVFGNRPKRGPELEAFQYFVQECEPVAEAAHVNIVPVWTNLRRLGIEDNGVFIRECFGATLGAVAHVLSGKLTQILIASGDHLSDLRPAGSTPMTDPLLSSFNLRIHHDAERVKRIDKVKAIADWQVGLDHLRVCFLGGPGNLNCGECEKCLRTKLALVCANRLSATKVFRNTEVSIGLVLRNFTVNETSLPFCAELIDGLHEAGFPSLARTVAVKRLEYYAKQALHFRDGIVWIDKHFFKGDLKHWHRRGLRPKIVESA